jgi:hypothetical protein
LAATPEEDSALHAAWGSYAQALAAELRGDHGGAIERLERPREFAESAGSPMLLWRVHRLHATGLAGLGDDAGAAAARRLAVQTLAPVAESLPAGPLRDGYTARHDVAQVLSWGMDSG